MMKSITTAMSLAVVLCLFSGHAMAENGIQAYKFKVPTSVKAQAPQFSLGQIYARAKSGELQNRPRLGGMDAGGGKILLCPKTPNVKATVLDVYEGQAAGLQIDLGNGTTLDEKIKYVLNRLSRVAPYRARAYAVMAQNLLDSESAFYSDAVMPVTDDTGVTVLPTGCQLVQVVVQRNDEDAEIPGFSRYLFDRDVFAQLDLDSQASLVLHEVIYREARARGETNSLRARYLNYLILSTSMETMTQEKFNLILSKMKSQCLEKAGALGQYSCPGLPDVYVDQSLSWKGIRLKGALSIAGNSGDGYLGVQVASAIDLTETVKIISPKTPFSIKISKGQDPIELSSMDGASLQSSDLVNVEAVGSRAKLKGSCLVTFKVLREETMTFYCKSAEVVSGGATKRYQKAGSAFYIRLLESGGIEVSDN